MEQTSSQKYSKFEANDSVSTKVGKCVSLLRAKGMTIPSKIADIPDLPVKEFEYLRRQLQDRDLLLQRLSNRRELWIEQAVTEPNESRGSFPFGAIVTTVGVIAFSIGVSWWYLLALMLVPIQFIVYSRKVSNIYDQKVMRAAVQFEPAFCMLYRLKQINLTTPDYRTAWFWKGD